MPTVEIIEQKAFSICDEDCEGAVGCNDHQPISSDHPRCHFEEGATNNSLSILQVEEGNQSSSLAALNPSINSNSTLTIVSVSSESDGFEDVSIKDPIEGHDSEFDVDLSPNNLEHSIIESDEVSEPSKSADEDSPCITADISQDKTISSPHPSLYGKVVKSIQKSIRRFFHCGREQGKLDSPKTLEISTSNTRPSAPITNDSFLNDDLSRRKESNGSIEVPLTNLVTFNNNPITGVGNNDSPLISTTPHQLHKTLLIDLSYSKPLLDLQDGINAGRKCLVLDLDETLVHSTFQPVANADLIVPVHLGEGVYQPIYVCKRPGVDHFLATVAELFEVVIFTASLSSYADPVINFLDPSGTISSRLYREDCLQFQGLYIKDLSRLGRDLDQVLIIDNSPASYSMQPQNALGCRSWFKDLNDRELTDRLLPMLKSLKDSPTVSHWRLENLEAIETPYQYHPTIQL